MCKTFSMLFQANWPAYLKWQWEMLNFLEQYTANAIEKRATELAMGIEPVRGGIKLKRLAFPLTPLASLTPDFIHVDTQVLQVL